jgi:hypothetical protein
MIEVRSPLKIEVDPEGGWQLIFWTLDAFNYSTPFRAMLAEIAAALGQSNCDISLPDPSDDEDFVAGNLRFGEASFRVYYEHALSYLSLSNSDKSILDAVADQVRPRIALV